MLDTELFNSQTKLVDYKSDVWRVVESQEYAATLKIVDDFAEQSLLEQMLDEVKPKYRQGTEGMHYLLKTAFRYPPLKWGSRFGTQLMPSYFYASEQAHTALCECAYYRFVFMHDMEQPYTAAIRSEYCLFKVLVSSAACLDLGLPVFAKIRDQLRNPTGYSVSQAVGAWAHQRGLDAQGANNQSSNKPEDKGNLIDIIRFESARLEGGFNVAVGEPKAIRSRRPSVQQKWLCLTKPDSVSFSSRESDVSYVFTLHEFSDEQNQFLRVK